MKGNARNYLLGAIILMCMVIFGTKNEIYALSTYLPEEYYSDVVEKQVTLQKLQDGARADSDDKYLVVDHEECWGTGDCIIFNLPEDGTVKISLKNISDQWMYGSNVLLFSNKDLTKKLNLELEWTDTDIDTHTVQTVLFNCEKNRDHRTYSALFLYFRYL